MKTRVAGLLITILAATYFAAPSLAADDVSVRKDLFTVITLQGLPCGQVISVSQQGENDYVASCEDGHRYRVFVNADGRVVVEKK